MRLILSMAAGVALILCTGCVTDGDGYYGGSDWGYSPSYYSPGYTQTYHYYNSDNGHRRHSSRHRDRDDSHRGNHHRRDNDRSDNHRRGDHDGDGRRGRRDK